MTTVYTNLIRNPRGTISTFWSAGGMGTGASTETIVTGATDGPELPDGTQVTSYARYTFTTATPTAGTYILTNNPTAFMRPMSTGLGVSMVIYMRTNIASTWYARRWTYLASAAAGSQQTPNTEIPADTWVRLEHHGYLTQDADYFRASVIATAGLPVGQIVDVTAVAVVPDTDSVVQFFDGYSPNSKLVTHAWTGTVEQSESTRTIEPPNSVLRSLAGKVATSVFVKPVVERNFNRAEADLHPFTATYVRADAAPIYRGYPKATPLWVRVQPVLSAQGEVVSSNRPRPAELQIDSDVRFVAHEDYWDETTGVWRAFQSNRQNYFMRGPNLALAPVLEETTYVSGREVITTGSFRISDGTKFLCEFHDGLDSFVNSTISMVIGPNPQTGEYPLLDWWHANAPTGDQRLALWLNDKIDFFYGGTGGSVDQIAGLNKTRPLFVTAVIESPVIKLTVAYSPRHAFTASKVSPLGARSQWMRLQVGGSYLPLTTETEADFNLFEFNLWDRALSPAEIVLLNSAYASTYGVASEWR